MIQILIMGIVQTNGLFKDEGLVQKRLFISTKEWNQECGSRLCRGDDSLFDSLTPASSCSPVNLDLDLE